jgi:protease-4
MKSFFRSFFASILAFVVIVLVILTAVAIKKAQKPGIKDHSYLVVDIYGDMLEYNPPTGMMDKIIAGEPETLQRILDNLEKASVDDRIDGVIMKLSSSHNANRAKLQEIRMAIKRVQKAGKKVYGFSDSMDRKTYYLAAACDSLFMPPTAYISFIGMSATSVHFKGTLEKLGIRPNLHRIKDYKSAAELVTRKSLSRTVRDNVEWMLEEYWDMFVETLREDRGLNEDDIVNHMNLAVFSASEALEGKLIDSIMYWDDLEDRLKDEDDDELRTVSQCRYAQEKRDDLDLGGKKKIAVVHAQGMIGGRKSYIDPMLGIVMGHESVVGDLRKANEDEDVVAIVFRIDSGGGDALTSDLISHQVEVVTEEKPVVASMVDVAASGGYVIAYRASKIVADPMTVTGSIGSITMKFNSKEFQNKLGITHDFVTKGPKALMFSSVKDFTAEEWERFTEDHWRGFNWWLENVAEHRGMTFQEVERLAHGRVWTGRQAKENGLTDEVGDLHRAIELAKELAEIPADEKVSIVHYPKKKGFLESVMGEGGGISGVARYVMYRFIRDDLAETWNLLSSPNMMLMEEMSID